NGLSLYGCYLRTTAPQRRGGILFGLGVGPNRWSCVAYCAHLRAPGFGGFTFQPPRPGARDPHTGSHPPQRGAPSEVADFQAALDYLKGRPDADPTGVGFFGISKGGGAGVIAAARDPYVRCVVTDGIFGTYSTMLPYMHRWIRIYSRKRW